MKKFISYFIILVILILMIFTIREFCIHYNKNINNTIKLSREEIIELLDKGAKYNNYYRSINTDNGLEEFYFKDGILSHYTNSQLDYWMNINENQEEMIYFDKYDNTIAYTVKNFSEVNFPSNKTQLGYYSTIYDLENFNYKYKGIVKFNDRDAYVVKTTSNESITNKLNIKYYIDKNTGVILKRIVYNKFFFITLDSTDFERNIKFDTVTNENILKPNLSNYTIEESTFPALTIY